MVDQDIYTIQKEEHSDEIDELETFLGKLRELACRHIEDTFETHFPKIGYFLNAPRIEPQWSEDSDGNMYPPNVTFL